MESRRTKLNTRVYSKTGLKRVFAVLLFIAWIQAGNLYAQEHIKISEKDVPAAVQQGFKEKYPDEGVEGWIKPEDTGQFIGWFMRNGMETDAFFSRDGKWIQTTMELKKNMVPNTILKSFNKSEYADWKVLDTRKLESEKYPKACTFLVENSGHTYRLIYSVEGKLLNKEKVK